MTNDDYNVLLKKFNLVLKALGDLKGAADFCISSQVSADKGSDPLWYVKVAQSNVTLKQASQRAAQAIDSVSTT
jgi:hypothetical protein